jgi:hypothetical protein
MHAAKLRTKQYQNLFIYTNEQEVKLAAHMISCEDSQLSLIHTDQVMFVRLLIWFFFSIF